MTASVLKQNPNTKRFKQTLIYFNTGAQYANFRGHPLHQATKRHLNNKWSKMKEKDYLVQCLGDSKFEPFCVLG